MGLIYFNDGMIDEQDLKLSSSNRSFRYGDGLFETIFISSGVPVFISLHVERLLNGMRAIGIEIPGHWSTDHFKTIITELCQKNNHIHARCRVTVWRDGGGLYLPEKNSAALLIELSASSSGDYLLNETGITLGVFRDLPKLIHPFSSYKTANAFVYVMAAQYAAKNNIGDVIVLNNEGRVADTVNSNLFIFRDRQLFTPAVGEGGVHGVMKQKVIDVCSREGIVINEIQMEINALHIAEEVFLTNAIHGIKWVGMFENNRYKKQFITDLIYILNEEKDNDTLVSP